MMKNRLLQLVLILIFGSGLTGCMVSGGILIEPEPVIIGEPHQKETYKKKHYKKERRSGFRIPPGHMPPKGKCRVWFKDRPPGHQPPPVSCHRIGSRVPYGAVVIRG